MPTGKIWFSEIVNKSFTALQHLHFSLQGCTGRSEDSGTYRLLWEYKSLSLLSFRLKAVDVRVMYDYYKKVMMSGVFFFSALVMCMIINIDYNIYIIDYQHRLLLSTCMIVVFV